MKKIVIILIALTLVSTSDVFAGNEDRTGAAGATQLLLNPWVRSTGLMSSNIATVRGIEGSFMNIAGLAFTRKSQIAVTNTTYLKGTDINIYGVGLSQKVGESGNIGLSFAFMDFGDLRNSTEQIPEGDGSLFSVSATNIGISYAKEFSNSIYGGLSVKVISESIKNVRSSNVAFDAGIQYIGGETDQIKIGISLKNVGPTMAFEGDGLIYQADNGNQNGYQISLEQRSEELNLPSLLSMGIGYDFLLNEDNKLTATGSFTANSFSNDQYRLGIEYNLKNFFSLRGGYMLEQDIGTENSVNVLTGLGAGISVMAPIGSDGGTIGFDYSYQDTDTFDGNHRIGVTVDL